MNSEHVVTKAREAKVAFGTKCSKFAGAVTVEILKTALAEEGIPTSPRDVFVRGIPVEIDLVVPRHGREPSLGVIYESLHVAAALEVKNSGSFGPGTLGKIRTDFQRLGEAGIRAVYVTLEERRGYRWAASTERLGFPCFTLAWHRTTGGPIEPTREWDGLVNLLRRYMKA